MTGRRKERVQSGVNASLKMMEGNFMIMNQFLVGIRRAGRSPILRLMIDGDFVPGGCVT